MDLVGETLFEEVVKLTGLSLLLAAGTVRRALEEAGVDPKQARRDDYLTVLASLKRRLMVYLPEPVAEMRIRDIENLLLA
jgi:hypothetical protein